MVTFDRDLARILEEVRRLASAQGKLTGFCIGNTRKVDAAGLYFSPIRITTRLIAGSAIVYTVDQAEAIARQVDGHVDYILVDTEKKVSAELYGREDVGNVERAVREAARCSKILTYKGNDLTVDCIEELVVQILSTHPRGLGGKRAAIIGAGNIGSKLALRFVERGMEVTVTRRDRAKLDAIVEALNIIKPPETIATLRGTTDNLAAAQNADLLIGVTHGNPVITAPMVEALAPGAILVDGGKGCVLPEAVLLAARKDIPIYRADIRSGFEGRVGTALETERIVRYAMGRREIDGVSVVSGGLLARRNEVVVDNVNDPRVVFGLADGVGDFIRAPGAGQADSIRIIQDYIAGRGPR